MATFNVTKTAFARERLTVSNAVKTLTSSVYDDTGSVPSEARHATGARISVETAAIRFTEEGTTPVATTTGTIASALDVIYLDSYEAIKKFKAIRDTGSDGTIEVVYYR